MSRTLPGLLHSIPLLLTNVDIYYLRICDRLMQIQDGFIFVSSFSGGRGAHDLDKEHCNLDENFQYDEIFRLQRDEASLYIRRANAHERRLLSNFSNKIAHEEEPINWPVVNGKEARQEKKHLLRERSHA